MIGFYLNQTAVWNKKSDVDEFNQPILEIGSSIACRVDYKRKMTRSSTGQEIVSESTLYTDEAIQPDDKITFDGTTWTAISSAPMRTLDGSILFYEVSL